MKQIGIQIDNSEGLVDHIKTNGLRFTEELGTFYVEDINQKEATIKNYEGIYGIDSDESRFYRSSCCRYK